MIGINQDTQIYVAEDQINPELTKIAQQNPKYQQYMAWLIENGTKIEGVEFPVAFGSLGYIGVAATRDIPPNKCFIAIPNKILISTMTVDKTDLGPIVKKYEEFFHNDDNDDSDFNKLSLFIMREKLKGKDSFWHPFLEITEHSFTQLEWSKREIKMCQDQYLLGSCDEFKQGMEETWKIFKKIFKKHQDMFPLDLYTRELFNWSYQLVMTRCYGWTMPSTCLVPLADCLNHSKYSTEHYMLNRKFELTQDEKEVPSDYKIKKKRIDLKIIPGFEQYSEENKEQYDEFENEIGDYVNNNRKYIKNNNSMYEYLEDKYRDQLIDNVREINENKLLMEPETNIWDLPFFSTSDSEDNDTDSDEENTCYKNDYFNEIKIKESLEQEEILEASLKIKQKHLEMLKIQAQKEQEIQKYTKKGEKSKNNLSENKWEWYEEDDDDIYFIINTQRWELKGKQVYNCYGRRTNRFLLQWYGFSYPENHYDSYSFRLWIQTKYSQLLKQEIQLEDLIFDDFISSDDWEEEKVCYQGKVNSTNSLSKEFRLKYSRICDQLISFIRIFIYESYQGQDKFKVMLTVPTSYQYEQNVLSIARDIVQIIYNQKNQFSEFETDLQQLKEPNISYKQRFSIILRSEHKRILKLQLSLLNIAINIIQEMNKGGGGGEKEFKQAYMKIFPEFETQNSYFSNREKLKDYLKSIYLGIVLIQN